MKFTQSALLTAALLSFVIISRIDFKTTNSTSVIKSKKFDNYPSDWAWIQRTFPFYKADLSVYSEAINERNKILSETENDKSTQTTWEFAGPINIGGRISDIEFNPLNPEIVYSGAATGGVFKSTDTGVSWFPVFDKQAILPIGDIAVDPVNPDIIYVGTGEANGGHNNFPGAGVFKSTDAGNTWENVGLKNTAHIGRIIVDHTNPVNIYTAAVGSNFDISPDRGVFKSTNGGNTWTKSLFVSDSTGAIDLIIVPNDPSTLFAAMWERVRRPGRGQSESSYGPTSGIYKTTDFGTTWIKLGVDEGLPSDNSQVGRIGLAISNIEPFSIFAMYTNGGEYSGLYKSENLGSTWTLADPGFHIYDGSANFSWYFGQIRVNPHDPSFVYALDVSFMRSSDGGNSFPHQLGYNGVTHLHVDHHALAFHPNDPNYIISGNDGGINISTDNGITWSQPAHLPITQFYEIAIDLNNPARLYGGTQDNSTMRTKTGSIDDWEIIMGGDGFYVNVDFNNPDIIYAEWQWGNLYKSTDGGINWEWARNGINLSDPTNWSTPVIMDPNNSQTLYYGTNRIYRTTNGAASWNSISSKLTTSTSGLGTITTIAVSPINSRIIYAGTDDSNVWVSPDSGTSWQKISNELPERWVTRVVPDPSEESKVYVSFSGLKWNDPQPHIFKSYNMGMTWNDISSNLPDIPINALAVDNNKPGQLYIGTDVGAFVSYNDGETWTVLGEGLPAVPVYDMKIHPTENYLAAGTHGRSMYKLDLNNVTSVDSNDKIIAQKFELFQNYPNPFNPTTTIKFVLAESEPENEVVLKVYDILGKEVVELLNDKLKSGTYEVVFNSDNLSSGIYFYRLRVNDASKTRKMILLR